MTTLDAEARALIGTRWEHRGRSDDRVDCIGLVTLAAERAGFGRIDLERYPRRNQPERLVQLADLHMQRKTGPLEPSDVVVLRLNREPRHFAIVGAHPGGGLTLIHAHQHENGEGKVVEHRLDDAWRALVYLQFRMRPAA